MGTLSAPPRKQIRVVTTAPGTYTHGAGTTAKARVWVLEDKTLVVATANSKNKIVRETYELESVKLTASVGTFYLADGTVATIKIKSCGCGMGVVASARVANERHQVVPVRTPDWVEVA